MSNLADLKPGEFARIASIDAEESLHQRLAEARRILIQQ